MSCQFRGGEGTAAAGGGGGLAGWLLRRARVGLGVVAVALAGCSESGPAAGALDPERATDSAGLVRVEALGRERRWHFSDDGPDGVAGTGDDRVSTGELTLPAHTDVLIHLRSRDTLYVFSCPALKLKEIAVPDLEFSLAFRTGPPGRHELAMDPMCGFPAAPGETMGVLRVVSPRDFRSGPDRFRPRPG